jgi:sirohydrochlorin cobaltochelatase
MASPLKAAVILVGHGVPASDTPRPLVTEFKTLEAKRRAGQLPVGPREAELDRLLRDWPRTPETDPYKWGLERLADVLRKRLDGRRLSVAFNEFCSPSVEETIHSLVKEGFRRVTLVPTMFTPGGLHSELEIPAIVAAEKRRHPDLVLEYAWPFDMDHVAEFLLEHLERNRSEAG